MANDNLELELQRVGLDEREARVYLSALDLGPSPVQKIAQRAGVPRATTYLVLDDLQQRGLVSTYEQGKKVYFIAQHPTQLGEIIKHQEDELKLRQLALKELVPELEKRGQLEKDEQSVVKYYQGEGGLNGYLRDLFRITGSEILSLMDHEESERLVSKSNISWDQIAKRRKQHGIKRRLIVGGKNPEQLKKVHKSGQAIFLPNDVLNLRSDIDVIGDYVGFMPYKEPIRCVLIKDKNIAHTLSTVFETLWKHWEDKGL